MSTPPVGIAGIVRTDTKQTDLTISQYDGLGRPGEIVVDLATYNVFVANLNGNLTQVNNVAVNVSNISNGSSILEIATPNGNITANVSGFGNVLDIGTDVVVLSGNLIPAANSLYTLGNATNQWKDMWISGSTIYIDGVPVSSDGTQLLVNGVPVLTSTPSGTTTVSNLVATGNITGGGNLSVSGNSTVGGNLTIGGDIIGGEDIIATGNVSGGNLNSSGTITAGGNVNSGGNVVATGNVSATNYAASGNVTAGGNISALGGLVTDTVTSLTGPLTLTTSGLNSTITLNPSGTGNVDVVNSYITNVLDPSQPQDAATKAYVDNLSQGILPKAPCNAATPQSLQAITGGTVTYNNGTAGAGATLTLSVALTVLDGVTLAPGMRILVLNQTPALQNGIYDYTSSTVLTRSGDSNSVSELQSGSFVFITGGTVYASSGFTIITEPNTVGIDPIVWAQFSGAGTYTAGAGLSLSGTQFAVLDVGVTPGTYGGPGNLISVTVNQKGQITGIANTGIGPVDNFTISNTLSASNINVSTQLFSIGPIQSLGSINGANITATGNSLIQGNLTAFGNLNVTRNANISGTLRTGNVDVIGNLNVANLNITGNSNIGGPAAFNGDVTFYASTTFTSVSNLRIGGGSSGQVLSTYGNGRVYWSTPTELGNVNIAGNLLVGGQLLPNVSWAGDTRPALWVAGANVAPPRWGSTRYNATTWSTGGILLGQFTGTPPSSGTAGGIYARRYGTSNDWNVEGKVNLFEIDFTLVPGSGTPIGTGWLTVAPASNSFTIYNIGNNPDPIVPSSGLAFYLAFNRTDGGPDAYLFSMGNPRWSASIMPSPSWANNSVPHRISVLTYKPYNSSSVAAGGGFVYIYLDGTPIASALVNSDYWWGGRIDCQYAVASFYGGMYGQYMSITRFYSGSGQQFLYNLGQWPHLVNMPT